MNELTVGKAGLFQLNCMSQIWDNQRKAVFENFNRWIGTGKDIFFFQNMETRWTKSFLMSEIYTAFYIKLYQNSISVFFGWNFFFILELHVIIAANYTPSERSTGDIYESLCLSVCLSAYADSYPVHNFFCFDTGLLIT